MRVYVLQTCKSIFYLKKIKFLKPGKSKTSKEERHFFVLLFKRKKHSFTRGRRTTCQQLGNSNNKQTSKRSRQAISQTPCSTDNRFGKNKETTTAITKPQLDRCSLSISSLPTCTGKYCRVPARLSCLAPFRISLVIAAEILMSELSAS